MRTLVTALAVMLALAAGTVQLVSEAFYSDLARAPAFPQLVPLALGESLARPLGGRRVPAPIRAAYARALLHRGAVTHARAIVATLPTGAETFELRGALAERAGNIARAVEEYSSARDVERAQLLIDGIDAAGHPEAALRYERELAASRGRSQDEENRARALWRMGQLTQELAVRQPGQSAALERNALAQYLAALTLAPNDETFLLAAGQQALTIGDAAAAAALYERAAEAVPNSVDAYVGLARAAAMRNDCARARANIARARMLAPALAPVALGACAATP